MITDEAKIRRAAALKTPNDLGGDAARDLSGALNVLLADLFALYLKTKNFLQRISDNDADYVSPLDMLAELREDNKRLAAHMRETHGVCDERGDVATASLLEVWIDEAEKRVWYLFEASRRGDEPGR